MVEDVSASGVATCLPRGIATGSRGCLLCSAFSPTPEAARLPVTAHTPAESHPTRHGMGGSICGLIGLQEMGSSSIRPTSRRNWWINARSNVAISFGHWSFLLFTLFLSFHRFPSASFPKNGKESTHYDYPSKSICEFHPFISLSMGSSREHIL